jgi:hypothetical protein
MTRLECVVLGLALSATACGGGDDSAVGVATGESGGAAGQGGGNSGAGGSSGVVPDGSAGGGAGCKGCDGSVGVVGGAGQGGGDAVGNGGSAGGGGSTSDGAAPKSRFPDTSARIAILADQFPNLSSQQVAFAASHFVGTEKQVLDQTRALRAANPDFVVLHYHLAMWQSAPTTQFILDGKTWSNDYPQVTTHEAYFWHNAASQRVASTSDQKLLMNVADPGFRTYWADSIATQIAAGEYDGVFFDSASPALLQGEASTGDPRLAATAVKTTTFTELGGKTWILAWEDWITTLEAALSAKGYALIPNTGAFITTWDNTNYGLSAGIFSEGFADPSFVLADWKQSTNELLSLSSAGKIMILQNYLGATTDVARRMYYLGNYLLVRGTRTYLDYFATGPLEWYPEWDLDLGAASSGPAANVDALLSGGVYQRDFAKGVVLVNPGTTDVVVTLGATMKRVVPSGGGAIAGDGTTTGALARTDVTQVTVAAHGAEILER